MKKWAKMTEVKTKTPKNKWRYIPLLGIYLYYNNEEAIQV